jgi:hypothetical protein
VSGSIVVLMSHIVNMVDLDEFLREKSCCPECVNAVLAVDLRVSQSTFIWVNPDPTTLLYNGMEMYRYDLGKALRRLC